MYDTCLASMLSLLMHKDLCVRYKDQDICSEGQGRRNSFVNNTSLCLSLRPWRQTLTTLPVLNVF